ncbi:ATP-binding cassette domain-containing protein [Variovorax sp. Sphag1AA]|uniref:ABC transporter ATP-binding protein n=1 Tax=Variovorax sp. Sphag1AA TaxID=2587027 RepID=UPI00160D881C|nr:ATP-binding cassette domain-containing protein [Variovorax sp. Sphag1AA]MBB3175680.1 ABC-type multidrug transport system ATPase subunit [Variovorax sp. Sphag1AA]
METTALSPILDVADLRFAHPGQPPLAAGWSTRIGAGVTLLYGDTGTGKSTLLRVLAGQLAAQGRLNLAGAHLDRERDAYQRNVFFCDPDTDAFHKVTALECATSLNAGDARFSEARWRTFVEGFSLTPHLAKPMYMLSTGSRRKALLAAALASGRPLILLDEPTAALDAASIRFLWRELATLAEQPDQAIVVASAAQIDSVPLAGLIELPLR